MRLAVLSDVHGNVEALRHVVAHLRSRAPDLIVNLGDCVTGPLWPRETFDELQQIGAITVRGNHDRWLAETARVTSSPIIAFTAEQLGASPIATLGALPARVQVNEHVVAVHGTPSSDTDYLLEDSVDHRLSLAPTAMLADRLGETSASLVLCGHSHQQHSAMANGCLILNPGSVGCPRYAGNDDVSLNEAGSPHARYAIATRERGTWNVELFALAYDWHKPARRAESVGQTEWAAAFLKGA